MRIVHGFTLILCLPSLLGWCLPDAAAQSEVAAKPVVGLRDDRPADYALVHAEVVVEPGRVLSDATVLVQGTTITAVGQQVELPAGCKIIDCEGKRVYAGLIDAWSEREVPLQESKSAYWNGYVTPQRNAAQAAISIPDAGKLRSQGITTRLVAPAGGIVKGSSSVVLLDGDSEGRSLLAKQAWQHLQLTVPREGPRQTYPNSPMGAVALLRQAIHDAKWYRQAWDACRANPELPRPETNLALQVLSQALADDTFVIDAPNERMAVRADDVAREFAIKMILRGSGREYRDLPSIVAANRPILLPVDFPSTPDVKSAQAREEVTLQELMHWDLAPENPARLAEAGVAICLTTDGLDDVGQFLQQVRKAVERGLPPETALAAMTTVPAELMGIEQQVGRVTVGRLANLAVTDGDLFDAKTKVVECWVAGKRFELAPPPNHAVTEQLIGNWSMRFRVANAPIDLQLVLREKNDKLEGVVKPRDSQKEDTGSTASKPDEKKEDDDEADDNEEGDNEEGDGKASKERSSKLNDLTRERDRITGTLDLHKVEDALPEGISLLSVIAVAPAASSERPDVFASLVLPDGQSVPVELRFVDPSTEAESKQDRAEQDKPSEPAAETASDQTKPDPSETEQAESSESAAPSQPEASQASSPSVAESRESTPILFPLGAYGLESPVTEQPAVLFRGATLWTCDESGVIESGDLLIREGLIVAVAPSLDVPADCRVIDVRGKHITPGLIDCHSHMATDGGINESGEAVTAEVRVGDFIDNSDINIYRQLAGGLTAANILHGSANPIGGQNQVIKLRWGQTMDGLRMKEAPPGIKFALGENVKRSQSRYPNSRMGVEQIIRDQLLAAREYHAKWRRWQAGQRDMLPPRFDLQLEALSEVQQGVRWVHCHSYRQDEIVATLDVLEEFGIQIGTLQHILEGYKVADRMARHGAMGSAFSDWWAYKFEVFDAIPYNGALMHEQGVVVSFNSDDRELARHMNTEAAKATKYGGVPEEEALKFVTLNPARQLRIDAHVGSLTSGKHADLVVWSGRPLSTLSRCEQSWIDGRLYFDLKQDTELRARDSELRHRLIQKALGARGTSKAKSNDDEVSEEDRWVRTDVYCAVHGGLRHETLRSGEQQ